MTVWKYTFRVNDETKSVSMPVGAKFLTVAMQDGLVCLWALVDPKFEREIRNFCVHGTGHNISPFEEYVGTAFDDNFVWHLFETKL